MVPVIASKLRTRKIFLAVGVDSLQVVMGDSMANYAEFYLVLFASPRPKNRTPKEIENEGDRYREIHVEDEGGVEYGSAD